MKTIKDRPRVDFKEKSSTGNVAVDYCELEYPKTCAEFKRIQNEQYKLFCKKHLKVVCGPIRWASKLRSATGIQILPVAFTVKTD